MLLARYMSSQVSEGCHTIWLGAAGTGTAFALLKSARQRWGRSVRGIAADINPAHLVAASALAQAFEQVPPVADKRFAVHLAEALARHQVDTYVPILDEEILLAATLRDSKALPASITTLAPSEDAARICLDKLAACAWLSASDIPTPATVPASQASWRPHRTLVKPQYGRGSVGVRILRQESELAEAAASSESLVVQELCRNPEVTIDAFRSRDGSLFRAVCRDRLEVKAGVCTKARVFEDETLAGVARRIADGLDLVGTFCVQLMRNWTDDKWLVTDINPRPGAGTAMSVALGVDFLSATLADAWQLDARPMLPRLTREHFVVRQYAEYAF